MDARAQLHNEALNNIFSQLVLDLEASQDLNQAVQTDKNVFMFFFKIFVVFFLFKTNLFLLK